MKIKRDYKYLMYLLRHKYHAAIACMKLGLYWRAVTHDLSKFVPYEWVPYAERFYGDGTSNITFEQAWRHHYEHNDHHWEYWDGEFMDIDALGEMVADWIAMGKTQGNSAAEYYSTVKDRIKLHPVSRRLFEETIGYRK